MKLSIGLAPLALILITACGSETSGTFEGEDGERGEYTIDSEDGDMTAVITGEDGTATVRSGNNVAVDLPDGFTVYPGAKVINNTVFERDEAKGAMVVIETEDSPEQVADFYREQAEEEGLEIGFEMSIDNGKMLGGEDGNGRVITVNATQDDGVTSAQLMIGTDLEQ
ncbi:MAG: hypothetical protein ABJP48_08250 [Erythrobacter sp.]